MESWPSSFVVWSRHTGQNACTCLGRVVEGTATPTAIMTSCSSFPTMPLRRGIVGNDEQEVIIAVGVAVPSTTRPKQVHAFWPVCLDQTTNELGQDSIAYRLLCHSPIVPATRAWQPTSRQQNSPPCPFCPPAYPQERADAEPPVKDKP